MIPPICILVDDDVPIVQLCRAVAEAGLVIGNVDGHTFRIRRHAIAPPAPPSSSVVDLAEYRRRHPFRAPDPVT